MLTCGREKHHDLAASKEVVYVVRFRIVACGARTVGPEVRLN